MNPEIKVIIYEEKNILKNLLTLLDEQYDYIINKDVIKMDKIASKLDETSTTGVLLNMRLYTQNPLSYVTWGQNVPDDIGKLDAQKIAKQLLGGNA